jgi:hypothetical protein
MRGGRPGLAGEVEANHKIRQRSNGQVHRIAQEYCAGFYHAGEFAIESDRAVGARNNGGIRGVNRNVHGADGHWEAPEGTGPPMLPRTIMRTD